MLLHNKNVLIEEPILGHAVLEESVGIVRSIYRRQGQGLLSLRDSNVDVFLSPGDDLPPER